MKGKSKMQRVSLWYWPPVRVGMALIMFLAAVLRGRNEYRCSGAVATTVNGATYFTFGGGYYQPFYGGSDVIYQIVSNPSGS